MKTLYLECNMGAAGDMLMSALLELHPDPQTFLERMNGLGLPGVALTASPATSCGITGTHVSVTVHGEEEQSEDVPQPHHHALEGEHPHLHIHVAEEHPDQSHPHHHGHHHGHNHEHEHEHHHDHDHEHHHHDHDHGHAHHHHHTGPGEIAALIDGLDLPEQVKADARAVYDLIAQAESRAHGRPVTEIHFHEVGTLDAVADVVGVCLLVHDLAPEQILASPIHVGSGQVRCAHGVMPVPAPATAFLLRQVPTYGGQIQGELCTPTGAALLRHFVSAYGPQPLMRVDKIGYGMGTKEFESANCVRAFWGETEDENRDTVAELRCNLDDMTPEAVAFAEERLLEAGALEVFTTPVQMKKGRPGVLLTLLCRQEDREMMTRLLFRHTTTLGVRETLCGRSVLEREVETVDTSLGPVRCKTARGWGVERRKWEYDDLARIAREKDLPLSEVERTLNKTRQ